MHSIIDNKKTCSKCGEKKDLSFFTSSKNNTGGKAPKCNECCKIYKREYYKKNKDRVLGYIKNWESNNKIKQKAHGLLNIAVSRGKIIKPNNCSICGNTGRIEAHHWKGYSIDFVYDVQWLCVPCHRQQDNI